MDRRTLIARVRQIQAIDMNALAIYKDLSELANDSRQRKVFSGIAADEKRHVALGQEMLLLLER